MRSTVWKNCSSTSTCLEHQYRDVDCRRYFQAASHAIGLADNDVDSEHQFDPTLGRVSLDPVLNALCQLGVHRLGCDRAFISLIDHENQYIISEMTKSVSLYDSSRHYVDDAVCMGARPIGLDAGVCAGTMPAFTGARPNAYHVNTPNMFADDSRYIINDFTLEPKYKDRPYVKGDPHMRFYAEVPITTSQGYVIGSYAVVDNKPRHGLDEQSFITLREIGASIMRHIEMVKIKDDYAQSSRLLDGLNSLVQDESHRTTSRSPDPRRKTSPPVAGYPVKVSTPSEDQRAYPAVISGAIRSDASALTSRSATGDRIQPNTADPARASTPASKREYNRREAAQVTEHTSLKTTDWKRNNMEIGADFRDIPDSADTCGSFGDAAESLRVAMDLESVLFLDATPNRKSSHTHKGSGPWEASEDVRNGSSTEDAQTYSAGSTYSSSQHTPGLPNAIIQASKTQRTHSELLGVSAKARDKFDDSIPPSVREVPESLHQDLLLRYPRGCVFNLGLRELPEDTSTIHRTSDSAQGDEGYLRSVSHGEIVNQLHLTFPHAKSVIFLPLWNAAKGNWFAGCLGWSSHPKRVLQYEDLTYFNVFGNSLMARAARLNLIATDNAKSDFISNISHELRSPLHGILGSTELLRDLVNDADQQQVIAMVERCSRTLLDTMNQL